MQESRRQINIDSPTDWEAQYRTGDMPWDKGAPSPALLAVLARGWLQGHVLVPGCGLGHDVRALAHADAEPLGLDISPSAVAAADALPKAGRERYEQADLFALPPYLTAAFDAIWEHTCYCAILPEWRPRYVAACAQALKPGGELLGVFYLDPGHPLPTSGPPFETTLASLDHHFADSFELMAEFAPKHAYAGREGREWVRRYRRLAN